ncbi:hypothetical protein KSP40_PGU000063 [Platanthera guangdongensis]|uniref:Uncharacterized protein n=1 Tax=Platanthera guangdongensis TaxID=2320717 RepID=A0ABR2LZ77_9ASPA
MASRLSERRSAICNSAEELVGARMMKVGREGIAVARKGAEAEDWGFSFRVATKFKKTSIFFKKMGYG